MTESMNRLAMAATSDERKREELIRGHEQTILRTASSACHRYVNKSDDEWSIALCAFSKAVDVYTAEKGDFLPFAQMLIKRDLIDYYRSQKNTLREVIVAPHVLEGGGEPEEDPSGVYLAVVKNSQEASDRSLRDEILAANELLSDYGFRFFDLTECSPQQDKTRKECAEAIRMVLTDSALFAALEKTRKLPIKALAAASGVSRKTLDRYRKYIIMAVLILDGDYPQLAEYLKFVKEAQA
jgi:RNA polymerase sigma factor